MSAHPAAARQNHAGVRELLPFFVNGTLSELENARVMRHVAGCTSCIAELGEQRRLMGLMRSAPDELAGDPQSAWASLERTLDAEAQARPRRRRVRPAWKWSLGLAAAAAVASLLAPIVLVSPLSGSNDYRTLTTATPDSFTGDGTIRVVFKSNATVGGIDELLDRTGCQSVSGRSPRGVYTLDCGAGATVTRHALATLRASPLVALAEPTGETPDER